MEAIVLVALIVFAFGLFSSRLERSIISAPIVFVTVGIVVSPLGLDLVELGLGAEALHIIAELTLVIVLFTDAAKINAGRLLKEADVPARLLMIGLPLTVAAGTLVAWPLFGGSSIALLFLLAAMLAPTDAALGLAVVSSRLIPLRIRDYISTESGLNDGFVLPLLLIGLAVLDPAEATGDVGYWAGVVALQLIASPVVGLLIGLLGAILVDHALLRKWMNPVFQRLVAVALPILAWAAADAFGGNGFMAAFFAGLMAGRYAHGFMRGELEGFAESEGQMLSYFMFFVFGLAVVPVALDYWDGAVWLYAILSLTVIRMLPVAISLTGKKLDLQTVSFIGWFGPRGIASILYLIIVVESLGVPGETELAGYARILSVVALTVLISIFVHGMSAVPLSRLYGKHMAAREGEGSGGNAAR